MKLQITLAIAIILVIASFAGGYLVREKMALAGMDSLADLRKRGDKLASALEATESREREHLDAIRQYRDGIAELEETADRDRERLQQDAATIAALRSTNRHIREELARTRERVGEAKATTDSAEESVSKARTSVDRISRILIQIEERFQQLPERY